MERQWTAITSSDCASAIESSRGQPGTSGSHQPASFGCADSPERQDVKIADASSVAPPELAADRRALQRDWVGLAILTLPCVLYSMDLTVLDLAVPALSADVRPTTTQLLWILDIYGFVLAGMLIPMGALGERIGRRRLLLCGAGTFAIASAGAAFCRTAGMLIAMRAVLGIAGATLAPATLSLIRQMFQDARERTTAISVWVAGYSAGAAIGPVLGGLLLQNFWWGSVFLVGLPMMALLLVLGPVVLPEYRDPNPRRIDFPSVGLSLCSILTTIYGLKRIAEGGFAWLSLVCIAFGLLLGWQFFRRQSASDFPLLNLTLFRQTGPATALATYTIASFVSYGSLVFVAQYMQLVLGLSAWAAGLWTIPFAGTLVLGSALTPVLATHIKPTDIIRGGLALAAVGFVMLSDMKVSTTPGTLASINCIYALGLASVFALTTDLMVGSVASDQAGAAAATAETGSELGGALGIALLGSVGAAVYRFYVHGAVPDSILASTETLGAAIQSAQGVDGTASLKLLHVYRAAFVESLRVIALISATMLAIAAMLVTRFLCDRPTSRLNKSTFRP